MKPKKRRKLSYLSMIVMFFVLIGAIGAGSVHSASSGVVLKMEEIRERIVLHHADYQVMVKQVEDTKKAVERTEDFISDLREWADLIGDEAMASFLLFTAEQLEDQKIEMKLTLLELEFEKKRLEEGLTRQGEEFYLTYFSLAEQIEKQEETNAFLDEVAAFEKERHRQGMITPLETAEAKLAVDRGTHVKEALVLKQEMVLFRIREITGFGLDQEIKLSKPALFNGQDIDLEEAVTYAVQEGLTTSYHRVRKETTSEETDELLLDQAERRARVLVEEAYRTIRQAEDAYLLQGRFLDLAKTKSERAKARHAAGLLSGLDVMKSCLSEMEARQMYTEAQLVYQRAYKDFQLARAGALGWDLR